MKIHPFAPGLLLVVPLAACASKKQPTDVADAQAAAAAEATLPEVRYYVIADT